MRTRTSISAEHLLARNTRASLFVPVFAATLLCAAPASATELNEADAPAQKVALAVRYEHGEGVARDYRFAHELYCEAAKADNADAQYRLGWMYANGRGVARSDATAAALLRLAAEQNHAAARNGLRYLGAPGTLPDCMALPIVATVPLEELDDVRFLDALRENPKARPVVETVVKLAPSYQLEPRLVLSVIDIESQFEPAARSPKNAQGLMQLIPETAERFNVRKPFDPIDNVKGGMAYLRWLLAYFRGDAVLAAAAYNAGEKAVDRYGGVPPYAETQQYVKRFRERYHRSHHPFDASIVNASLLITASATAAPSVSLGAAPRLR